MDQQRAEIVSTARSLLGPPAVRWRHQGRDPTTGLDCAGLIIWVGWETGFLPKDFNFTGYQREPDGRSLAEALAQTCVRKQWADWAPGDIVLLKDLASVWPCHMGILAQRQGSEYPNLIHSWCKMKRCVIEVRFEEEWQSRMAGLYQYKGLDT